MTEDDAAAALNEEMNLCIEALDKTTIQRDKAVEMLIHIANDPDIASCLRWRTNIYAFLDRIGAKP